jgi:hypothetical protein
MEKSKGGFFVGKLGALVVDGAPVAAGLQEKMTNALQTFMILVCEKFCPFF